MHQSAGLLDKQVAIGVFQIQVHPCRCLDGDFDGGFDVSRPAILHLGYQGDGIP